MALYPAYILILCAIILIDFSSGLLISKSEKHAKLILFLSILSNVLLLIYFKYTGYFYSQLNAFAGLFSIKIPHYFHDVILPVGLSFHTFQSMSYTIDVYHKKVAAEKHLGHFANYVLFFPQMVAGPIERYDRLGYALQKERKWDYSKAAQGFRLIIWGLFVKMCIADNLATYVNAVYSNPEGFGYLNTITAIIFFSIQIYADFYGYSTIAVGSARALGIPIMHNFDQPYFSLSIREFWTRWHISLSQWFKDYLYIPLGGNRRKLWRNSLNIIIVFGVSGLWHGANTTFIIWGLLHGIYYLSEIYLQKKYQHLHLPKLISMLLTFILVSIAWVFFRADSFHLAMKIIRNCWQGDSHFQNPFNGPMALNLAFFICIEILLNRKKIDEILNNQSLGLRWIFYTITISLILITSGLNNLPFIYFQF